MFRSFFNKDIAQTPTQVDAGPRPDRPLIVMGDIHGCDYLFELLMGEIDKMLGEGIRGSADNPPHLVFVGDYIDRGPCSRQILDAVKSMADDFPQSVICLKGNHEQMLLDFLDKPVQRHARWLRNGGYQTCTSYGLKFDENDLSRLSKDDAKAAAQDLKQAMVPEMIAWLRKLPTRYDSGNVSVVHAAADPSKAMNKQSDRVFLWGHPEFLARTRTDNHWIVHGHTIVADPQFSDNRISIDTGGYTTGMLTAAIITTDGEVEFLQTE